MTRHFIVDRAPPASLWSRAVMELVPTLAASGVVSKPSPKRVEHPTDPVHGGIGHLAESNEYRNRTCAASKANAEIHGRDRRLGM